MSLENRFKMPNFKYLSTRIEREIFCFAKFLKFYFSRPDKDKKTLLVVGAQRSGTNLLMDVLERNFSTDVYHERDARAFDDYQMRSIDTVLSLKEISKANLFVIKGLCESQRTEELLDKLAPAKAIWVVRDFNDVVNSMNISFKETRDIIKGIKSDRKSGGWRTEGMSDVTYEIISPFIHEKLSNVTASAIQWYMRNIIYFEKNYDNNSDIKVLIYNDLVTNPSHITSKVCEFSGLQYKFFMNKMINKNSIRKSKSPDIEPDVRELCEELWERFQNVPGNSKV